MDIKTRQHVREHRVKHTPAVLLFLAQFSAPFKHFALAFNGQHDSALFTLRAPLPSLRLRRADELREHALELVRDEAEARVPVCGKDGNTDSEEFLMVVEVFKS